MYIGYWYRPDIKGRSRTVGILGYCNETSRLILKELKDEVNRIGTVLERVRGR